MRVVLGIDAAWTQQEPSGIALIVDSGSGWALVEAAASYAVFLQPEKDAVPLHAIAARFQTQGHCLRQRPPSSEHLLMWSTPIIGRRASDNMISTLCGARHASTAAVPKYWSAEAWIVFRFSRCRWKVKKASMDGSSSLEALGFDV
ncbi:hypothetical protein QO004_003297 [Rhizobium mesoamericanum]|nr:hypothetical protein [Rhizobium mesoamericanum]